MTSPQLDSRRRGFSTISALISLVLLGFIMAPIVATILAGQRGFVDSWDRSRAGESARYAHLSLTRLIRSAGSRPAGASVQAIDPDPRGDGLFDDIRIRSDYNPPDGDLDDPGEDLTFFVRGDTLVIQSAGGAEEPYLIGVDSLAFMYFDIDGDTITDPDRVGRRAVTAHVTVRARGEIAGASPIRVLDGIVRIRNGR